MGPYYVTALVSLIGRVSSVSAMSKITFPQREITSEPQYGKFIDVKTPTHIVGSMQFDNGAIGSILTSFDVWGTQLPRLEIYGTEGSLAAHDPNNFGPDPKKPGGFVHVKSGRKKTWKKMPLTHGYSFQNRGIGLADMADAIIHDRPHRANGAITFHTLEIMEGLLKAAELRREIAIKSAFEKPEAFSPNGHQEI
jgi:predicted dehydrogenase